MQLASYSLGDNLNKLVHSQGQVPFGRRSYSHYADGKQLKACLEEFAFGGHTVVSQGGYSGFLVTGMIEGFFWVEIFDSWIFLGRKIWQVFFWVA